MNIRISRGNTKTGTIPAFSLAPGRTCSAQACATCLKEGCYARKLYNLRPTVRNAWDANTELVLHSLDIVESELDAYFSRASAPRFFRVHVSGDFVNREYAEVWARVARKAENTRFLAFTKQFDIVRGVEFPGNFSVVLSAWPGLIMPDELLKRYPVAWLDVPYFIGIERFDNALECPGQCDTCGACWALASIGRDIKFKKH